MQGFVGYNFNVKTFGGEKENAQAQKAKQLVSLSL
jgi:hypothetical protein